MLQPTNVLLVDAIRSCLKSEGSTIAVMDQFLGVAGTETLSPHLLWITLWKRTPFV